MTQRRTDAPTKGFGSRYGSIVVGVVLAVGVIVPASAKPQGDITVREGQTIVRDFPAMGAGAGTENQSAHPDLCQQSPTCDVVKLHIVLPADFDESNEFAVQVRLDWNTRQLPNDQGQANDLDLFLWDEPAGDPTAPAPIARSVGTRVPEIVGLSKPQKGTYNITIRNASGVNEGYKLTVRWIDGRLSTPLESQEPDRATSGDGSVDEQAAAPPADSGGTAFKFRPSQAPAFLPPSSPGSGSTITGFGQSTGVDPQLDRIGAGSGDLSSLLGGDERKAAIASIIRQDAKHGPARPPSGVVMVVWLGAVPLVLLAAIGLLLYRFRPVAMSMTAVRPTADNGTLPGAG
ncbi:MAG: hypothetical protein QOF60_515 [Actinomycetota bacterium]|jgi:hypothetical protein|nr:hypothetical protein [Actinomycetota bacterium]